MGQKPARTPRRTFVRAFNKNNDDAEESCELPSIQLQTKSKPDSFINLAVQHFSDEFGGIGEDLMLTFKDVTGLNKGVSRMPTCLGLVLDDEKVVGPRPPAPRVHTQPCVGVKRRASCSTSYPPRSFLRAVACSELPNALDPS